MRIINVDLEGNVNYNDPIVACIGYFDGIHLGHQALIDKTIEIAREKGCSSALITFQPDPWETIKKEKNVKHISTMKQRINLAGERGIQNIIILNFTEDMSQLSPKDFVDKVLGKFDIRGLICGFDFKYGFKGEGDYQTLKEQNKFDVYMVESVNDEYGKISSTRISAYIQNGEMEKASALLGYYYMVEGVVVFGKHNGHSLGFPTANIKVNAEYILPKTGVYAGYVFVNGKRYRAMINYGHNPTISYLESPSLEAYLLDFDGDLYNKTVFVQFVEYMRDEKKFKHINNLILQLEQDSYYIRSHLKP